MFFRLLLAISRFQPMSFTKTFTNSIVREIGRNYGKAASNYLLGDKHSTPIRVVGANNDIARKRGTKYQNNFDKSVKQFQIVGARGTFTKVLNIHREYFVLVSEANEDSVLDLNEMAFLIRELPRGISTLEGAKQAFIDLDEPELSEKTEEKIQDFKDFLKSLDESLDITKLPETRFKPEAVLFFLLSFLGLDRIYYQPKQLWSYIYGLIGLSIIPIVLTGRSNDGEEFMQGNVLLSIYGMIALTLPFWYGMILNPKRSGGYWHYRDLKKRQGLMNEMAISIKQLTTELVKKHTS